MGPIGCDVLVPVPDELTSKAAAAAVLLQGMTAHVMTHDVHHGSPGESALVHAAAAPQRPDRGLRPVQRPGSPDGHRPAVRLDRRGAPGSVWLTWPTLADYNSTRDALVRRAAAVFGAVLDGTISPAIAGSLPLRRAARAHELLEARATTGKLLLEP
jgi:NADPH:quinone reductase-like Zn-dependent oxidoreductase